MIDTSKAPVRKSVTVIPDIHSRNFWMDKILTSKEVQASDEIIFLGDYCDPHSSDWAGLYGAQIGSLLDVLALKEDHKEDITLLMGNHDMGYLFGIRNTSRTVPEPYFKMFSKVFQDNADKFRLTATRVINGKVHLFSHAGITQTWLNLIAPSSGKTPSELKDMILKGYLNKLYKKTIEGDDTCRKVLIAILETVHPFRGGDSCGSVIWADQEEWYDGNNPYSGEAIQVIGHNRLVGRFDPQLIKDVFCYDFYNPRIEVIS